MNPNSSQSPPLPLPHSTSSMDNPIPSDEPSSSSLPWDWSDLLDFTIDPNDDVDLSFDQPSHPLDPGRVRKRDPRLSCENFLAGMVPCACPELDAVMEAEEEAEEEGGKKKKRARRASKAAVVVRCQVAGCEADISQLKGYHRRHRVCLGCANAKEVLVEGQKKRYCQQCGKFHILTDFDEGKRSCRRKLERHNNRRRRKPNEPRVSVERESEGFVLSDDLTCEDENGKDSMCLSNQIVETAPQLESEGQVSVPCSNLGSQNVHSDSALTFTASDETQADIEKDESKYDRSAIYVDKKTAYSSMCPTGRISFKLYDWNPAEFPRRLRHQIFQWLASMPVELEGYIRPGCTILTAFIVMPDFMWRKLLQEPLVYISDFVAGPDRMLSGRGTLLIYLDNMIFRVLRDGISVTPIKAEECTPRLHYVHPTCFEAGKPIEFVACGSNLLQPKFRFLVSFGGKYLAYEYSVPSQHCGTEQVSGGIDNQLLKIFVSHTEADVFGPAFVEVENQSGLSNFIPILIGNREICSEMKLMEQRFEACPCSNGITVGLTGCLSDSCEASSRRTCFSQFMLDTAWLLRKPVLEDVNDTSTSFQVGRLNRLLTILIKNKSTIILEQVLNYMEIVMDHMKLNYLDNDLSDTDIELLQKNMAHANQILTGALEKDESSSLQSRNLVHTRGCSSETAHVSSLISSSDQDNLKLQDAEATGKTKITAEFGSSLQDHCGKVPLLSEEVVMNMTLIKEKPMKSFSYAFTKKNLFTRPLVFAIASAAVCLCVCAVFIHPQEVSQIVTTIRSSLFAR